MLLVEPEMVSDASVFKLNLVQTKLHVIAPWVIWIVEAGISNLQ